MIAPQILNGTAMIAALGRLSSAGAAELTELAEADVDEEVRLRAA